MPHPLHFNQKHLPVIALTFQVEDDTPLFAVITQFLGGQVHQVTDMLFAIQQVIEQFNQIPFVGSPGEDPFEGPVGQDVDVFSPYGLPRDSKASQQDSKTAFKYVKGGFSFYRVRRNTPIFDKKNHQKNHRHLVSPPDIHYLALLLNGFKIRGL